MLLVVDSADIFRRTRMEAMARRGISRKGFIISAIAVQFVVVSCTYVPDKFNPIEWYKKAGDWFMATESNIPEITSERVRPRHETFPDINAVPDRVPPVTPKTERGAILEELVSDRANARYSDKVLQNDAPRFPLETTSSPLAAPLSSAPEPSPEPSSTVLQESRHGASR